MLERGHANTETVGSIAKGESEKKRKQSKILKLRAVKEM